MFINIKKIILFFVTVLLTNQVLVCAMRVLPVSPHTAGTKAATGAPSVFSARSPFARTQDDSIASLVDDMGRLSIVDPHVSITRAPDVKKPSIKLETLFFQDLAGPLHSARTNPEGLYLFLSSDACKKFPFLLVVAYIKLLELALEQTISPSPEYRAPFIFRTAYDKDPRVFALLKAAGASEESRDNAGIRLKHVDTFRQAILLPAEKLIHKNCAIAQKMLLDFYFTAFKKLGPEQAAKIDIFDVIKEIFLVQNSLPTICTTITPELVATRFMANNITYVHNQYKFEAHATSMGLEMGLIFTRTIELIQTAQKQVLETKLAEAKLETEVFAKKRADLRKEEPKKPIAVEPKEVEKEDGEKKVEAVRKDVKKEDSKEVKDLEAKQAYTPINPDTLQMRSLAITLDENRENPDRLYLYLGECKKYPILLVIAYMRMLDINPDQYYLRKVEAIDKKVEIDPKTGALLPSGKTLFIDTPLIFRAVHDFVEAKEMQAFFVYTVLSCSLANTSLTDIQGTKISELEHSATMSRQFDSTPIDSVKNICALVDFYIDFYLREVDMFDLKPEATEPELLDFIAELFILKAEMPIFLAGLTPDLIVKRMRVKKISPTITPNLLIQYAKKYVKNTDVMHVARLLSGSKNSNLALKQYAEEIFSSELSPERLYPDEKKNPASKKAAKSPDGLPSAGTGVSDLAELLDSHKPISIHTLQIDDLAEKLAAIRDNPEQLYAFLSGKKCQKYPITLVIVYMQALHINPNQNLKKKKTPLIFQAVQDRNTRIYTILAALGAHSKRGNGQSVEQLPGMSHVSTEYRNNGDYNPTTEKNQLLFLDFYLDFLKNNPQEDRLYEICLINIIQEIHHLKKLFPTYLSIISDQLIRERIAEKKLIKDCARLPV